MTELLETWSREASQEDGMTSEHAWIWAEMIRAAPVPPQASVLDIGCNQGGFLRVLYDDVGFEGAVGIDLAQIAVARANASKGQRPIKYIASPDLSDAGTDFDIAYSHEVIYLIDDLGDHARRVMEALKPGGSYFAVTCCHSDNPLWPVWREKIGKFSRIPVPNHSVGDIVAAFRENGFTTSVSRFLADSFIPMDPPTEFLPTDLDRIDIYARWKIMVRATKPND